MPAGECGQQRIRQKWEASRVCYSPRNPCKGRTTDTSPRTHLCHLPLLPRQLEGVGAARVVALGALVAGQLEGGGGGGLGAGPEGEEIRGLGCSEVWKRQMWNWGGKHPPKKNACSRDAMNSTSLPAPTPPAHPPVAGGPRGGSPAGAAPCGCASVPPLPRRRRWAAAACCAPKPGRPCCWCCWRRWPRHRRCPAGCRRRRLQVRQPCCPAGCWHVCTQRQQWRGGCRRRVLPLPRESGGSGSGPTGWASCGRR